MKTMVKKKDFINTVEEKDFVTEDDEGSIGFDTEIRAFFFGGDLTFDEAIQSYLKSGKILSTGASFAQISNSLCFKYHLMSERRLRKRLEQLLRYGIIKQKKISGFQIYIIDDGKKYSEK
jgi:hypothetical protein